jgi:signal peptidase I
MTIETASSFFAWDISAFLALFLISFFVIVLFDRLFFNKSENNTPKSPPKKGFLRLIYFLLFLRFEKNEKYKSRPKIVQWSAEFFPILLLVFMVRGLVLEPFKIPSNSMMPTLLTGDFIVVSKLNYGISIPILNKKIIEFSKPKRGDVVVFRYPNYEQQKKYKGADFIKRIIGLPGDKVVYKEDQLSINGVTIAQKDFEDYLGVESGVEMTGFKHKRELLEGNPHDILLEPFTPSKAFSPCQDKDMHEKLKIFASIKGLNPQAVEKSWELQDLSCSLKFLPKVPKGHYLVMGDNRAKSSDSRFWGYVPESYIIGKAIGIWMHLDKSFKFERLGGID